MSGLVSCGWLQNAIRGSLRNIRVLETCWAMRGSGQESFLEEHIPSSNFFDLWKCCTPTQERPRALHDPKCFEEYAQSLGINNDSHIIIYDKGAVFYAARLWFQFKAFGHNHVSVVDGGMIKWLQDKLPVETGPAPEPEAGNFQIRPNKMMQFITMEQLFHTRESMCQIVDTRRQEDYEGETEEPNSATQLAFMSAGLQVPSKFHTGHIPGSMNLCYERLLDEDTNCYLSEEPLRKVFQEVGFDPCSPSTTVLCYSGVCACMIPLAVTKLHHVTPGPTFIYDAGEFKVDASLVGKYFKSFEDVSEKNYSKRTQVIDTRDAEYFSGSLPEPSPATTSALLNSGMALPTNPQCGHIPGAVNLYYDTLLHPATRTILPKDQILTVLKDKGIDVSKPITSLCFNGIAACLVPLALSQLDQQSDVTVYQGSWTEYSQRATSEMVSKSSSNGNAAIGG